MSFKQDQQARFWELQAQRDAVLAQSEPLRRARDDFANQARAHEQELNDQIAAIEAPLADIDNEWVFLARGLGSVGPKPEA